MSPRRPPRRILGSGGRTALGLGALLGALSGGCSPPPAVPTAAAESRSFELRVTAEGVLQARNATDVRVPDEAEGIVRLAWIAPEGSAVVEGDVVARFDGSDLEAQLTAGRGDLEGVSLRVTKTDVEGEAKLVEIDTDSEVAQLELEVAQRFQKTDDDVFSRHEIIESRIDELLAEHRLSYADASRGIHRALLRTELELLGIDRRKAELKVGLAEKGLAALEVRAPHAGLLTHVRNWQGEAPQVGNQMWPGQVLAEVPDLDSLEAEVFVLEADAGGVAIDKRAEVVVEAHPEAIYPARIGRVDSIAKPRFRGSPVQYFGVGLELEEVDLSLMKPGQRVRAALLLEERAEALVVPRQAVMEEGGRWQVYVQDGGGFAPRRVELGPRSMGLVVVEAGLRPGERVALDPLQAAVTAPPLAEDAPSEPLAASASIARPRGGSS